MGHNFSKVNFGSVEAYKVGVFAVNKAKLRFLCLTLQNNTRPLVVNQR